MTDLPPTRWRRAAIVIGVVLVILGAGLAVGVAELRPDRTGTTPPVSLRDTRDPTHASGPGAASVRKAARQVFLAEAKRNGVMLRGLTCSGWRYYGTVTVDGEIQRGPITVDSVRPIAGHPRQWKVEVMQRDQRTGSGGVYRVVEINSRYYVC